MPVTHTIDIQEEANEILDEEVGEIESTAQELVEKIRREYGDYEDVPQEKRETYDSLQSKANEKRNTAYALLRTAVDWSSNVGMDAEEVDVDLLEDVRNDDLGDTEFVVRELTVGLLARVQDTVAEESVEYDAKTGQPVEATPKQGYGTVETLRAVIEEQPSGAPVRTDEHGHEEPEPADYPLQVGDYLFDRVDELNTVGEVDMGNSLQEAMEAERATPSPEN